MTSKIQIEDVGAGIFYFNEISTGDHRPMVAALLVENLGSQPLTGFSIEVTVPTSERWIPIANLAAEFTNPAANSKIEVGHGTTDNDPTILPPGEAILLGIDLKFYPRLRVGVTAAAPTSIALHSVWGGY